MDHLLNVLIIGGGGREHALAWKLSRSASLGNLWATHRMNPGIAALTKDLGFDYETAKSYRLGQFCKDNEIDLVVVGPEGPLAAGLADELGSDETFVFGPCRAGAQLEADKSWAKQIMRAANVPTAEARTFDNAEEARRYVMARDEACVVKASGLAAGKGVYVACSAAEAAEAIDEIMVRGAHGDAGRTIVIEERLQGPEVSVFALVDGRDVLVLDTCQDHKRVGEGDTGPNTGGMGAYSPTPFMDADLMSLVQREILIPTVDALRREGIEYRGVLYAGLMLTPGGPKVLEYNVRFGDPECQVLMPRMDGDLARILHATAAGQLDQIVDEVEFSPQHTVCVVLASEGYPGRCQTGVPITGLEEANAIDEVQIFHAGTRAGKRPDEVVTAGGRVLNVVASGATLFEARDHAQRAIDLIHFDGMMYRRDIGHRALGARQ